MLRGGVGRNGHRAVPASPGLMDEGKKEDSLILSAG